jgi:hypothetical protein
MTAGVPPRSAGRYGLRLPCRERAGLRPGGLSAAGSAFARPGGRGLGEAAQRGLLLLRARRVALALRALGARRLTRPLGLLGGLLPLDGSLRRTIRLLLLRAMCAIVVRPVCDPAGPIPVVVFLCRSGCGRPRGGDCLTRIARRGLGRLVRCDGTGFLGRAPLWSLRRHPVRPLPCPFVMSRSRRVLLTRRGARLVRIAGSGLACRAGGGRPGSLRRALLGPFLRPLRCIACRRRRRGSRHRGGSGLARRLRSNGRRSLGRALLDRPRWRGVGPLGWGAFWNRGLLRAAGRLRIGRCRPGRGVSGGRLRFLRRALRCRKIEPVVGPLRCAALRLFGRRLPSGLSLHRLTHIGRFVLARRTRHGRLGPGGCDLLPTSRKEVAGPLRGAIDRPGAGCFGTRRYRLDWGRRQTSRLACVRSTGPRWIFVQRCSPQRFLQAAASDWLALCGIRRLRTIGLRVLMPRCWRIIGPRRAALG